MRLCFGTFAQILLNHRKNKAVGIRKVGETLVEYISPDYIPDPSNVYKYVSCNLDLPSELVGVALNIETLQNRFEMYITDKLGPEPHKVLPDISWLISSDDSIPSEVKSSLIEKTKLLADNLPRLLAEVFHYVVQYTSNFAPDTKVPLLESELETEDQAPCAEATESTVSSVMHNLTYRRNKHFTGRDDELSELRKHFAGTTDGIVCQVIHGPGGMGKTQLALEYAHASADEGAYDVIWWLDAQTLMSLEPEIRNFVQQKNLTSSDDPKGISSAFRDWFENHSRWLLICDDVGYFSMADSYLPRHGNGHILYTAQKDHKVEADHVIDLTPLSPSNAGAFLQKRTEIEDSKNALELARRLGRLPMALEYAATYILENDGTGFAEYLSLLSAHDAGLPGDDPTRTVRATWRITTDKLSVAARQLLYLCSYFTPNYLDPELFSACSELLPAPVGEEIADPRKTNGILRELKKYGLIDYKKQRICVHPLLQEVIRAEISEDTQYIRSCLTIIQTLIEIGMLSEEGNGDKARTRMLTCIFYGTSVASLASGLLPDNASQLAIADALIAIAEGMMRCPGLSVDTRIITAALAMREKILGMEHILMSKGAHVLGKAVFSLGNSEHARMLYADALAGYKKLGAGEADLNRLYMDFVLLREREGNFRDAIAWLGQILTPYKRELAKMNARSRREFEEEYIRLSNNAGDPNAQLKTVKLLEELEIIETTIAIHFRTVGYLAKMGDAERAEALHQEAVRIRGILDGSGGR